MCNVLIVDNEKLSRESLCYMVSKIDEFHLAKCVSSGEEAILVCQHENVDIVFIDIIMPGMSGIDVCKVIYEINPDICIYIISASRDFELVKELLNIKVRRYFSKPISFSSIEKLFIDYQKMPVDYIQQHTDSTQLYLLLDILNNRQYDQICVVVPEIVKKIFNQEAGNIEKVSTCFAQLAIEVLNSLYPIDVSKTNINELFPIKTSFERKSIFWYFWLSDVMDYSFRQIAISKNEFMQTGFAFIDRNIKNDISLNSLCEECNISQSYISKIFKRHFGISIMNYIHLRKLKLAQIYLVFTDMNITDISYQTGYNESSYFIKVFKKYIGTTPLNYKKLHFKDNFRKECIDI